MAAATKAAIDAMPVSTALTVYAGGTATDVPPLDPGSEQAKEIDETIDAIKKAQAQVDGAEIIGRIKVAHLLHEVKEKEKAYGKSVMLRIARELDLPVEQVYRDAQVGSRWDEAELTGILSSAARMKRAIRWSHLQVIAQVDDKDERDKLVRECVEHGVSVRRLKARVRPPPSIANADRGKPAIVETTKAALPFTDVPIPTAPSARPASFDDGVLIAFDLMVAHVSQVALSLSDGTVVLDREAAVLLLAEASSLETKFEQVWLEMMDCLRTAAATGGPEGNNDRSGDGSGETKSLPAPGDNTDGDDDDGGLEEGVHDRPDAANSDEEEDEGEDDGNKEDSGNKEDDGDEETDDDEETEDKDDVGDGDGDGDGEES